MCCGMNLRVCSSSVLTDSQGSKRGKERQKSSWLLVGDRKILFLRVALLVATERFKLEA